MMASPGTDPRPRGGRIDKRQAILAGALSVFARDGYTRAGMEAIAGRAEVSTRTIYNHFTDKAELFRAVIQESATRVAEAHIALLEEHLGELPTAEALDEQLISFGVAWSTPSPEEAEHFALVRQVNAEREHVPPEAIEAWLRTGPRRVRRELEHVMRRLAAAGLVESSDPERAAHHFGLLITVEETGDTGEPVPEGEVRAAVTAGVRTFLDGRRG